MFPISVLPFAALLNRFGALGVQVATNAGHMHMVDWWIATIVQTPGATVFNNLPIFFAIGTAFGLSKDYRGEAALAGAMFYLILYAFTKEGSLPFLFYKNVLTFHDLGDGKNYSQLFYIPIFNQSSGSITGHKFTLNIGVLGGIVAGCLSAYFYNKCKDIILPKTLSFFGGRRLIPMIVGLVSIPVSFAFAIIWPWLQFVLVKFGNLISSNKAAAIPGAFFYGVINRLAQPFGLHHIINTFLWFQLPVHGDTVDFTGKVINHNIYVNGDITAFNKGMAQSGTFQSGYFPLFLGGEPGACLAMILSIKNKQKRKEAATFLISVATVAFITGIDEPLVFSFLFISPLLWGLYALFTGITAAIVIALNIHMGFGFSAGLIDYVISFAQSWGISKYYGAQNSIYGITGNPLMMWPVAMLSFAMFFFSFKWCIIKFNIMTPGREEGVLKTTFDNDHTTNNANKAFSIKGKISKLKGKQRYNAMGAMILEAVGGYKNVVSVGNCATRLRLELKNNKINVNDTQIKEAGSAGIVRLGTAGLQIIIGTDVEFVSEAFSKCLEMKKNQSLQELNNSKEKINKKNSKKTTNTTESKTTTDKKTTTIKHKTTKK